MPPRGECGYFVNRGWGHHGPTVRSHSKESIRAEKKTISPNNTLSLSIYCSFDGYNCAPVQNQPASLTAVGTVITKPPVLYCIGRFCIRLFPALIYILWYCAFELTGIKKIIKRNSEPITDEFNSNDAGIAAVAINDIF